jgi:hypothetical protein
MDRAPGSGADCTSIIPNWPRKAIFCSSEVQALRQQKYDKCPISLKTWDKMGHVGHAGEQRTLEAGTFETEWNVFNDEI